VSSTNRVIWSEGVFLKPHHFQQQDRYIEHMVGSVRGMGLPHPWGLRRLALDHDLLAIGKVAITEVVGVLPDGTPVDAPTSDPLPEPLAIDDDAAGQTLYIALPLRRPGVRETGTADEPHKMLRYLANDEWVRDNTIDTQTEEPLEVGSLALSLFRDRDNLDGFAACGIVKILECQPGGQVVLDDSTSRRALTAMHPLG